jgi:RNA polymerase sigma-70 factor (ECF subfamily)
MEELEQSSEVLAQFAAGQLEPFEMLFRQFHGEIYGWIVRIVRDPGAAEDLTLETFWRIYRAHARFDPSRNFAAWARRIATNVAIDHLKSARSARRFDEAGHSEADLAAGAQLNPGVRRELRERTQRAFLQLRANLRIVATLALIEERPHNEIAEALNISPGAVKSRLFRAVRLLRKKLKDIES